MPGPDADPSPGPLERPLAGGRRSSQSARVGAHTTPVALTTGRVSMSGAVAAVPSTMPFSENLVDPHRKPLDNHESRAFRE